MRTFKVLGGGPLAGQVFYVSIVSEISIAWPHEMMAVVSLDEQRGPYTDDFVVMDLKSGAFVDADMSVCSDYLRVDPDDLPFLQHAWREARGEANTLQKLTADEVARMRDIYAMYPLTRRPIDTELERKGWVRQYEDDDPTIVGPSLAAYGIRSTKDEARRVLYQENGTVHPYWRLEVST